VTVAVVANAFIADAATPNAAVVA
ncbi:hypothetical protein L195_g053130, partial [Trifolium pratense]